MMAMTGDQPKSLGVLKDSYIKKHGRNPVTLALYNKTTGEKINLKFKKVIKPEENEPKDNGTCIDSLYRGIINEDIVKEQTKHHPETETQMVFPESLPNDYCFNCRLKKTPHMTRPASRKTNKEFKNNQFADYETMLLKIIADLMTDTEADLVKKHSGFCILNGLVVKSHVNIKDENIIVVNTKLAKEGGVLLDIPAETINLFQINKDSKAISKLNTDEIKANIIIKPFTLVIGDSIVKIRICNKLLQTDTKLNYKENDASTQTDNKMDIGVNDTYISNSSRSMSEEENFDILNNVSLKAETTINSISVSSELLEKTCITTSEINFAIDESSLTKSDEWNKQSNDNLLINTNTELNSNKKNSLSLNNNKNNLQHFKYIKRLHNLTRRALNEKNKSQIIDICEKLIKLCKLLQMRNHVEQKQLNIDRSCMIMCSSSNINKFTTKNLEKLFRLNEIRNSPSYSNISTTNHKFGSDELANNTITPYTDYENNITNKNNVKEGINTEENDISHKEDIVISNDIYKIQDDLLEVNTIYTKKIEDQHEVGKFDYKAKLFSNASTMTERLILKNDSEITPVKIRNNKSSMSSYPNCKTPKLCTRLKRNEVKHKIDIKKYLAQEINKFKKDIQKYESVLNYDINNDKIVRKQKVSDKISISQNSLYKTHSFNSDDKINCTRENSSAILKPIFSEPLDEIQNKFTLYGYSGSKQFKYSTSFLEKIDSQFQYSDSSYLTDDPSHLLPKPMFQKRIGSEELSDTSAYLHSKSDNVKVACDKCNKLCEITIKNEQGQLKLQLKSHICIVNSNQIQRFSREESYSKYESTETFSSQNLNSHLNPIFETAISEKDFNILTKLPTNSNFIDDPIKIHSENFESSNHSLKNKFIETSSSSSTLPQSVRSSDKTDSKSKLNDDSNNSMEGFLNTQNQNVTPKNIGNATNIKQFYENDLEEESVEIECEQCGKLRTLNISKKNGNMILELTSHICLTDKNKECGDLDKLTSKLIPLNEFALTSLDKKYDLGAEAEVVTNIVNYCSNTYDNNFFSQENKANENSLSDLINGKNCTDIQFEHNLNEHKILEDTTCESFLNQIDVHNSDELLLQIQNFIKNHLKIIGALEIGNRPGDIVDSDHNKNNTTQFCKKNNSTSIYDTDSFTSYEKNLNKIIKNDALELGTKQEKTVQNESLNQNNLIIKTDVKENITTNEMEDNFVCNANFELINVFNREEFENSSSHEVFNQEIKQESVFYFDDDRKTDKDQEIKNSPNEIADLRSTVRINTLILNANETSMKKNNNNKIENGESIVQYQNIFNRENISDNQYKLRINRVKVRENLNSIISDEPVLSQRCRDSSPKSKPLKSKKKKKKQLLCVIL